MSDSQEEKNKKSNDDKSFDKGKIRATILKAISESKARGELSDEKIKGKKKTKNQLESVQEKMERMEQQKTKTIDHKQLAKQQAKSKAGGIFSIKKSTSPSTENVKPELEKSKDKTESKNITKSKVEEKSKDKKNIKSIQPTTKDIKKSKSDKKNDEKNNSVKKPVKFSYLQGFFGFILNLVITLFLLFGLTITLIGVGIYKQTFFSSQTRNDIVNMIPYPAGIVNNHFLSISEFRNDIAALNRFYAVQVESGLYDEFPAGGDVQDIVWERFVLNSLLQDLADQYQVEITSEELDDELSTIIAESGSRENLEKQIAFLYGWSVDIFMEKVIKPYILQEKLAAVIFKDDTLRKQKEALAREIQLKVASDKENFSAYAEKYSEDEISKHVGGDLGYFVEGVILPEIETVLQSMEVGAVSQVLESGEGFEIVILDDRLLGEDNRLRFKARRILIRYPTFEELLNNLRKQSKIYRFVK